MKPAIELLMDVMFFVLLGLAGFYHLFKGVKNAFFHYAGLEQQQAFTHC